MISADRTSRKCALDRRADGVYAKIRIKWWRLPKYFHVIKKKKKIKTPDEKTSFYCKHDDDDDETFSRSSNNDVEPDDLDENVSVTRVLCSVASPCARRMFRRENRLLTDRRREGDDFSTLDATSSFRATALWFLVPISRRRDLDRR